MRDDKLAVEEARRAERHESVKSQIEGDVNAEIAERADRTSNAEAQKMEQVAGEFRGKAIKDVVGTEREVERARGTARVSQVVDYVFYVIFALLGLRLLLALLAARPGAGFVRFIHNVTEPLYRPFHGIVASPSLDGGYTLALPIVLAILVYALLYAGITGLLRIIAHRKTEV